MILCIIDREEVVRYGNLKRAVFGITNTMLAQSLKELESDGLVLRKQYDDPYTGEKTFYDTQSFDKDISSAIGATVSVYIDPTNPENYYVDFDPNSIAESAT